MLQKLDSWSPDATATSLSLTLDGTTYNDCYVTKFEINTNVGSMPTASVSLIQPKEENTIELSIVYDGQVSKLLEYLINGKRILPNWKKILMREK